MSLVPDPASSRYPHPSNVLLGQRSPLAPRSGLDDVLAILGGPGRGSDGVTCHVVQAARAARHVPWPAAVHPAVREALRSRGIEQPFVHQAAAMAHVLAGRDVVVVTPTASGKSLCYAAPILSRCLEDPSARALLVFPTKALALDQAQALHELARDARAAMGRGAPEVPVATYDGDTPADVRRAARERARLVVTNPDMLHAAILPHHARWAALLQGLSHVVLDELHVYRGVFGSHVANVLRRLRRVCEFHGSAPVFVTCSATIANPLEHAVAILGTRSLSADRGGAGRDTVASREGAPSGGTGSPDRGGETGWFPPVSSREGGPSGGTGSPDRGGETGWFPPVPVLIDDDGSPRGERHVVLYDPPVVNAELGLRASAVATVRRLATRTILGGFQTITFAGSRLTVEILARYLKEELARAGKDPALVEAYRGGHLPNQRRETQRRLRDGSLRGVVATSALELGLDVGSLDVAILCGYPGTVASTWQQMGRAGRRGRPSACILVARQDPLDQHVVTHPEILLGGPSESARLHADNLLVLTDHLKCAAFELPFRRGEAFGGLDAAQTAELLTVLSEEGIVHEEGGTFHWTQETHPAEAVSLRSVSSDNFVVVDTSEHPPRVIAEVDFPSAPTTIHEKAIYLVGAKAFQVDRLDYEGRKAYVTPVDSDYYTNAIAYRSVAVLESFQRGERCGVAVQHGEVRVSVKAIGFKKVKFWTSENLGYGDVTLPEHEMHTTSYWFTVARPVLERLADEGWSRREVVDGLAGAAHAVHAVACLVAMCDGRDLQCAIGDSRGAGEGGPGWFATAGARHRARTPAALASLDGDAADLEDLDRFEPTLFLYDDFPGGVGLSELLHDSHDRLVRGALDLVRRCACPSGCPSCVGPRIEMGMRCKEAATRLLEEIAGAAPRPAGGRQDEPATRA